MFRFKRIIYLIFCLFLVLVLGSCQKPPKEGFLGISKVELTINLYDLVPHLELYLFSSKDYDDIKIKENKLIEEIFNYKSPVKLIKEGKTQDGYLHLFRLTFKPKEFILQNLTFIVENQEVAVKIGMYQTILLEPSTFDIHTSINIYEDQELKGLFNVNNKLYNPIYLLEQSVVSLRKQQLLEPSVVDKMIVYADTIRSFDIFTINPKEKYHQVGGIVQSKFQTNLEEYIVYTTYYYNNMPDLNYLSSVGIDTSMLEVIKNS